MIFCHQVRLHVAAIPPLFTLGDLPRPPGSSDCPTAKELRRALARATGPAAMAALVGIAHLGRRTAQRLAACGLPTLLPGLPFHLDIPGPMLHCRCY